MLSIPDRIYIGDMEWRVFLLETWVTRPSGTTLGWTDEATQHLYIYDGTEDQVADTFFHEVLHAVFFQAATWLPYDQEEQLIRRLTPVLRGLMRDNPMFVDAARHLGVRLIGDTHDLAPVLQLEDIEDLERMLPVTDEAEDTDESK